MNFSNSVLTLLRIYVLSTIISTTVVRTKMLSMLRIVLGFVCVQQINVYRPRSEKEYRAGNSTLSCIFTVEGVTRIVFAMLFL